MTDNQIKLLRRYW